MDASLAVAVAVAAAECERGERSDLICAILLLCMHVYCRCCDERCGVL